jgi:hypothetical protein
MERQYDVFECMPDVSLMWRGFVHGLEKTHPRLQVLGTETENECFARDTPTHDIVARVNTHLATGA